MYPCIFSRTHSPVKMYPFTSQNVLMGVGVAGKEIKEADKIKQKTI